MATNAQGRSDRTLALAPTHAIRTSVRSTAFRVACWAGGIAVWLALAFAAGAEPTMNGGSAAAPSRTPSMLMRRLKPSAPSPSRAALAPVVVAKLVAPKALDFTQVYRLPLDLGFLA